MSDDTLWLLIMHGVKVELTAVEAVTYDVSKRMLTVAVGATLITRPCSALDAARMLQMIGDLHA